MAIAPGIGPDEMGKVNSRHRIRRHLPRRRYCPVAAIEQLSRCIDKTGRLRLRKLCRRCYRCNLACAVALVVAQSIDINGVRPGVCGYLEKHRVAGVDADIGSVALYRVIAGSSRFDVPYAVVHAGKAIFGDDGVRRRAALGLPSNGESNDRQEQYDRNPNTKSWKTIFYRSGHIWLTSSCLLGKCRLLTFFEETGRGRNHAPS